MTLKMFDVSIPNDPTIGGDYDVAKELNVVVAGFPEKVRAHYDELSADTAVEYVIACFVFLSHNHALRSMDLFAEHVLT